MCVERKRDKNAVCIYLYIKCMRMYAAALQSVSSSPFHHTCCSISSPRHSWLKFCPSCSSGNLAVCAPLTPAMRAVNCWLLFHSDLESARQQSKAFAFKALKLIWNAKGSYWKYVFNGGGRLGNVYQGQRGDWLRSVRDRISSHVLLNTTFSLSLLTPTLVPTPPTPLSPSLSLRRSLQPKFWTILTTRTLDSALWMKRKTLLLPRSWVSFASHCRRPFWRKHGLTVNDTNRKKKPKKLSLNADHVFESNHNTFLMAPPAALTERGWLSAAYIYIYSYSNY